MGTRCITNVIDDDGNVYVSLYRQYDGYPAGGHGEELADFLSDAVIGNGIRGGENRKYFFNGVGDLACRLVHHFKSGGDLYGGFYLQPASADPGDWSVDFVYTVRVADPVRSAANNFESGEGSVSVKVESWDTQIFRGTNAEYAAWIEQTKNAEESEDW